LQNMALGAWVQCEVTSKTIATKSTNTATSGQKQQKIRC
jgi:hypothetical protein